MTIRVEHLRVRGTVFHLDAQRVLPAVLLAGYGIFILSLFARNVMTWYINPNYVLPTTVAGALLIGVSVVRILPRRGGDSIGESCCATDDCGCDDTSPRLWTYGFLAIPLLLAIVFPPRSLAAFSANQRGVQAAGLNVVHGASVLKRVSLSVDTSSFTMQDWIGALSADPNPRDYQGKPVVVTGMVVHSPAGTPPGYIMVLRYQVTCCIADARAVGLIVKDTSNGALKDNQWVTVTGAMGADRYQGSNIAVVIPKNIAMTKSGNPYMY